MADSLVLTGSRQVTKHAGDEMQRHDAPRGGNTWQIPRWWAKGNGVVYTDCTVFKVTTGAGVCHLAVESSPSVNLRIDHDGSFGFTFSGINEVSRAALFTDTWDNVLPECSCVEEPGYVCGEMSLYRETGTAYDDAKIDLNQDPTTVNSYQPARVTLQGLECIPDAVSDIIGLQRRGNVGHVPPPKSKQHTKKGHHGDPCCATCH